MVSEIVYKLNVDISQTKKSISALEQEISKLQEQLKLDDVKSDKFEKSLTRLTSLTKQLENEQQSLVDQQKQLADAQDSSASSTEQSVKSTQELIDELSTLKTRLASSAGDANMFAQGIDEIVAHERMLISSFDDVEGALDTMQDEFKDLINLRSQLQETLIDSDNTVSEIDALSSSLNSLEGVMVDTKNEFGSANFSGFNSELANTSMVADDTQKSLNELELELKELEATLSTTKAGTKEYDALNARIKDVKKSISDLKGESNEVEKNIATNAKKTQGVFKNLKNSVKENLTAIPGLIAAAFAIDKIKDWGQAALDEIGRLQEFQKRLEQLTGQTGDALVENTNKLVALTDVTDQDFNQTLEATNALAESFNITFDEALTQIERGLNGAANVSGKFNQSVKQFSASLGEAGFEASQLVSLLEQSRQEGLFDDKSIKAVNEANKKLQEGGQGLRDALSVLGDEFGTTLVNQVQSGGVSVEEALGKITAKLQEGGVAAGDQAAIIKQLFSSAGQDAAKLVPVLDQVINKQEELIEPITAAQQEYRDLIAAQTLLNNALIELGDELGFSGTKFDEFKVRVQLFIVDGVLKLVDAGKSMIRFFENLIRTVKDSAVVIGTLAVALVTLNFAAVKAQVGGLITSFSAWIKTTKLARLASLGLAGSVRALGAAIAANPIGAIITVITILVTTLSTLEGRFEGLQKVWNRIAAGFKVGWELIKKVFFRYIDLVWSYIKTFFINPLLALKDIIVGIFTLDPDLIKNALSGLFDSFVEFGEKILSFFTDLWDDVFSFGDAFNAEVEKMDVEDAAANLAEDLDGLNEKFHDAKGNVEELTKVLNEQMQTQAKYGKVLDETSKEFQQLQEQILKTQIALDDLGGADLVKSFRDDVDLAKDSMKDLEFAIANAKSLQEEFNAESETYKGLQSFINDAQAEINKRNEETNKILKEQKKIIDGILKAIERGGKLKIEANFEIGGKAALDQIDLLGQKAKDKIAEQVQTFNDAIDKAIARGLLKSTGEAFTEADKITTEQQIALNKKQDRLSDEQKTKQITKEFKTRSQIAKDSLEIQDGLNEELSELEQDRIDREREIKIDAQIDTDDLQREIEANTAAQEQIAMEREDILATSNQRSADENKQLLVKNFEENKKVLRDIAQLRIKEIESRRESELDLLRVEEVNVRNAANTEKDIIQEKITVIDALEKKLVADGLTLNEKQLAERKKLTKQIEQLEVNLFRKIEDFDQKEVEINKESSKEIVQVVDDRNNQIEESEQQTDSDITEIDKEKLERRKAIFETSKELALQLNQIIFDAQIASIEKEIEANDARVQANEDRINEIDGLEDKVNKVRARKLRREKKQLEEQNKVEAENKKQLERDKAIAERNAAVLGNVFKIGEAITNTAVGVTRSFTVDPTGILAALVAAQGAIQVGLIAAQSFPPVPEFAQGGTLDGQPRKGGVFKGRSHAEGGIMVNSGAAEVEGDEIILTKGVFRNPQKRAIASALNVSEGGVPFAKGGVMNASLVSVVPKLQAGGVNLQDTLTVSATQNTNAIISGITEAIATLPAPIVGVEEFVEVQDRLNVTVQENTF